MKKDTKKMLMDCIRDRGILVPSDDIDSFVSKLSEEEMQKVISAYENLRDYQNEVRSVVSDDNPDLIGKIDNEYFEKLREVDQGYVDKMQQNQKKMDDVLDELEDRAKTTISNIEEKVKQKVGEDKKVLDEYKSLL